MNIECNCTIEYSSDDRIIRQIDLLIGENHQIRWSLERGRILREGRFPRPRTAAFRIAPDRRYVTLFHPWRARPFFLLSRVCKRAARPFGGQQSQKPRQATLNYTERDCIVDVNAKRIFVKLTRTD